MNQVTLQCRVVLVAMLSLFLPDLILNHQIAPPHEC